MKNLNKSDIQAITFIVSMVIAFISIIMNIGDALNYYFGI